MQQLITSYNADSIDAMKFINGDPPSKSKHFDYDRITKVLRANPGQWADLGEGDAKIVAAYASRFRGYGGRFFEFTSRSVGRGTGRSKMYGRYVGDTHNW